MRLLAPALCTIVLAGCDGKIDFGPDHVAEADVEKSCALVRNGMNVAEVDALMHGTSQLGTSEPVDGVTLRKDVVYWNGTADLQSLKEEPAGIFIPRGKTCKVYLDRDERVVEFRYRFVDEAEYQSISRKMHSPAQ